MKKIITLVLALVLCMTTLIGCFSDPVEKELKKFINEDMVEINKLYEEIQTEDGKLSISPSNNDDAIKIIEETLLPKSNKALELVSDIEVKTVDVRVLRDKYKSAMEFYVNGYEKILSLLKTGDESLEKDAYATLNEAYNIMTEYDNELEKLVKKTGIFDQQ